MRSVTGKLGESGVDASVTEGTVVDERGETPADRVSSVDWKFGNIPKIGTAARKGSGDVEVKVWDGLVGGDAVVLPDRHAWPFISAVNGDSGITEGDHHCLSLPIKQVQE